MFSLLCYLAFLNYWTYFTFKTKPKIIYKAAEYYRYEDMKAFNSEIPINIA